MKKNKILIPVVLLLMTGLFAFVRPGDDYFQIARSLDIFATLFKEINSYYVDEVDPERLIGNATEGILESLDPYTVFIPAEAAESFSIQTTGQYAGIGALVTSIEKKIYISQPYEGFPAYQAGIRVGDQIVSVGGKPVNGNSTTDVTTLLKGPPDTEVELVVRRQGVKEDIPLRLTRKRIKVKSVAWSGLMNPTTGYIQVSEFNAGTGREVEAAFRALREKGITSLILDLRDNPGGLLYEAVNVANLFLPKGKEVVSTRGKMQDSNKIYSTLNEPLDTTMPMVVLVSGGSASASEIVAGALQDYDRAVLVGQKTFGKGLVQITRPLPYDAQIKLTTARYYIPSGRCIQALDYSKRDSDGLATRTADSLKMEFKTAGGRKVYDGGGLDPDLKVTGSVPVELLTSLYSGGHVFMYAREYCAAHPAPADWSAFRLTPADLEVFRGWLAKRNFQFETVMEQELREFEVIAKKNQAWTELGPAVSTMRNKISSGKNSVFSQHQSFLISLLEQEIAFHYKLDEGRAGVSFGRDPALNEAGKLLADASAFKKILSSSHVPAAKP
jgi:carboxyl-terminal processing protease